MDDFMVEISAVVERYKKVMKANEIVGALEAIKFTILSSKEEREMMINCVYGMGYGGMLLYPKHKIGILYQKGARVTIPSARKHMGRCEVYVEESKGEYSFKGTSIYVSMEYEEVCVPNTPYNSTIRVNGGKCGVFNVASSGMKKLKFPSVSVEVSLEKLGGYDIYFPGYFAEEDERSVVFDQIYTIK